MGSIKMRREGWPPTEAQENEPSTQGSLYQRVALARFTTLVKLLP